jgi:hypothetical protein
VSGASSEGSHALSGALVAMESRGAICPVATPEGGPIAIAIPVLAHGQRQANAGGGDLLGVSTSVNIPMSCFY